MRARSGPGARAEGPRYGPGPSRDLGRGSSRSPDRDLGRRNIYILPTAHGLTFCAVAVVTLLGATNYNNSMAFMLTFLLAGLGLVSMLHTYRNLAGLRILVRAGEPVLAGGKAPFLVALDNSHGPMRPGITLQQGLASRRRPRARPDTRSAVGLAIQAGEVAHVTLPVVASRRGWCWPQRMHVSTRVPLGLFRAWVPLHSDTPCLIYPRPAGTQPLPWSLADGERAAPHAGQGDDDFAGLRSYRPGDSPRRIHWRAATRGGPPPVKVFDARRGEERVFRYDDVLVSEPEDRLCQLSAWLHEAHREGLAYNLQLPAQHIPVGSGPAHLHHCLRALAMHGLDAEGEPA